MTDVFMEQCPIYMMYGMTWEQYWYGDPWMARSFQQYFLLKQRKRNEEMWIQGAYICNAVTIAIANCFSKKRHDYMKQPLDIYPRTDAEEREEIRMERQKLVQQLSMLSRNFKRKEQLKGADSDGNKS